MVRENGPGAILQRTLSAARRVWLDSVSTELQSQVGSLAHPNTFISLVLQETPGIGNHPQAWLADARTRPEVRTQSASSFRRYGATLGPKYLKLARQFLSTIGLIVLLATPSLVLADEFSDKLGAAETLARQGNFAEAEHAFLEALRLNPNSFIAHHDLGTLYMHQERYDVACHEFAQAASLNPALAEIQQNLGSCLFQKGDLSKAVVALRKAKELDPEDLRTRFLLGYSNLLLGQAAAAASDLEYVRKRKPGDELTLFYLVRAYTQTGEYDKGIAVFQELEQANPNSVYVHIIRGESYELQDTGQAQAIDEFKKAIALAPDMPKLHFGLGFLYWEQKRFSEAEAEFREELRQNPHFAPADYYLGDIALNGNDYARAGEFFHQALEDNPRCMDAYLGMGKIYARQDHWQDALQQFQRAEALDPNQESTLYWLGTAYRRLGDLEKSKQALDRYQTAMEKSRKDNSLGGRTEQARKNQQARWTSSTCAEGLR